jgi:hypothetical protein
MIFYFTTGVLVVAVLFTLGVKEFPLPGSFEEEEENRKKRSGANTDENGNDGVRSV